ncbi:hypothetical protein ACU635_51095 [[Actinomadura] parvosata]|uniref:hypothetical protein n=1 Tax=[Actinomadura] parvosata TaxID=1955412 RepID=UPI00406CE31B
MFMRILAVVCAVLAVVAAAAAVVVARDGNDWPYLALDAVGFGAAALVLRHFIRRPAEPAPAEPNPDPWAPVVEAIRGLSTDELRARWNIAASFDRAGSPVELAHVIVPALAAELVARDIPTCRCGAPQPGGIHTRTCQESS